MISELFFAKFLEILATGSLEIGNFLLKESVSIFRGTAQCAALNQVLPVTKKKLRIAGIFASLPFLIYLKTKAIKTLRSIIEKIAQIVEVLSK